MKKRFVFLVFICLAFALVSVTCKHSGLGTSVDISAPKVLVTYPEPNATIRGQFVLAGTASDDTGIERISISVSQGGTPIEIKDKIFGDVKIERAPNGGGWVWSVPVNIPMSKNENPLPPLVPEYNYPLKDGTYSFDVLAYDTVGRESGKNSRAFDIDNTAPVLLLNKPLAVFDDNPTSYGRALRIAGDASDDHNLFLEMYLQQVEKPYVDIKKQRSGEDLVPMGPVISFSGADKIQVTSMSSDAPLVVAKYFPNPADEDQRILSERYKKIYGEISTEDDNKDKYFYTGMQLSDNAYMYTNPASGKADSEKGNTTKVYFVYSQNLSDVLSKIGTDGVKAGNIKDLLSGKETEFSDQKTKIKDALQVFDETEQNYNFVKCDGEKSITKESNVFKLNPDNNPTWSIGGYQRGTEEFDGSKDKEIKPINKYAEKTGFRPYSSGGSLTLTLVPNADKDYVRPKDISLYIQKYILVPKTDKDGNEIKDKDGDVYYDDEKAKSIGERICIIDANDPKKSWAANGDDDSQTNESASKQISISEEDGINGGEYYLFVLEGKDGAGNEYVSESKLDYGFVVAVNSAPGVINVKKPLNGEYFRLQDLLDSGDGIVIEGEVKSEDAITQNDFDCKVTVYDGIDVSSARFETEPKIEIQQFELKSGTQDTYIYKVKLSNTEEDLKKFDKKNYRYQFAISITNAGGTNTKSDYVLYADNAPPKISITNTEFLDAPEIDDKKRPLVTDKTSSYRKDTKEQNKTTIEEEYFNLKGSWSDEEGSGTKTIYYSTTKTEKPQTLPPSADSGWAEMQNIENYGSQRETSWDCDFDFTEGEGKIFAVFALDKVGNASEVVFFDNVMFDKADPIVSDVAAYSVISNGTSFVLSGKASDSYSLSTSTSEAVHFAATKKTFGKDDETTVDIGGDLVKTQVVLTDDKKSAQWQITVQNDASQADGEWVFSAYALDKAGRKSKIWESEKIVLDTKKPSIKELWIEKGQTNNKELYKDGNLNNEASPKEVWFNTQALDLSGIYSDEGSGIDTVYYWINPPESPGANAAVVLGDVDKVSGKLTIEKVEKDKGLYHFAGIGAFKSGRDNTVYFQTRDKAGNLSALLGVQNESDGAAVSNAQFKIDIDQSIPSISSNVEAQLTNGTVGGDITISSATHSAKVVDDASGVIDFKIFIGADINEIANAIKNPDATDVIRISGTPTDSNGQTTITNEKGKITLDAQNQSGLSVERTWNATINASAFNNIESGTLTAYGVVYDKAGNNNENSPTQICTITIDKIAPEIEVKTPRKSQEINKKAQINGTAKDNQNLRDVEVKYKVGNGAWTNFNNAIISSFTGQDAYGWALQTNGAAYIDTEEASTFGAQIEDGSQITLQITAHDKAGNEKVVDDFVFVVNQHSDRPIVNITSISNAGETVKYATNITGTLIDDDATSDQVVKIFIVSDSEIPMKNGKLAASFTDVAKYTECDVSKDANGKGLKYTRATGDWDFTPANTDDGEKTIYFYIEDNEGACFYFTNTNGTHTDHYKPYVSFRGGVKQNLTSGLSFKIDSNPPQIEDSALVAFANSANGSFDFGSPDANPQEDPDKRILLTSNTASKYLGGTTRTHIKFRFKGTDQNGIQAMEAVIKDSANQTKATLKSGQNGTLENGVWEVQLSDALDKTNCPDGSYSVDLLVTDGSGLSATKKYLFATDFTKPEIKMISPSEENPTTIIASADLRANVSDVGAGTKMVSYLIPTAAQQTSGMEAATGWTGVPSTVTFSKMLKWNEISRYSVLKSAGGYAEQGADGLLSVPIWFKVEDVLGNAGYEQKTLRIDPKASLAKVALTSPVNRDTVGSTLTLNGTASVGEGAIQEVRIKIDVNNDGVFDAADYRILSGNAATSDIKKFPNSFRLEEFKKEWQAFATESPSDTYAATGTKRLMETGTNGDWYVVADGTYNWKIKLSSSLFNYTNAQYNDGSGGDASDNPVVRFQVVAVGRFETDNDGFTNFEYDASGQKTATEHIRPFPTWPNSGDDDTFIDNSNVAYAKDFDGTLQMFVKVDSGVPKITVNRLVQRDPNNKTSDASDPFAEKYGKIVKTRMYESGMYVSRMGGDWYLDITFEDETALSDYMVSSLSGLEFATIKSSDRNTIPQEPTADDVPLVRDNILFAETSQQIDGRYYLEITATDKTGKTGQIYVNIWTDSTAPQMARVANGAEQNGNATDSSNALYLIDSMSQRLGGTYGVTQSDGDFGFGGTLTEDGSGLAYLAFWFERQPKAQNPSYNQKRVYNPMIAPGNNNANRTDLIASGTTGLYMNADGLAVWNVQITRTQNGEDASMTNKITIANANSNIRQGGLVQIDGSYFMIKTISQDGKTITLDGNIAFDAQNTSGTASFVHAQVVNRLGSESNDQYRSEEDSLCDGDGMNELVKFKTGTYTWQAEIPSDNIPDGPIIIHATAIDGAGNVSFGSLKTNVTNNRPRVTRVLVATDWNNSGNVSTGADAFGISDDIIATYTMSAKDRLDYDKATPSGTNFDEFVYYSTIENYGKSDANGTITDVVGKSIVTLTGGMSFTVVNNLLVIPEFTGGNTETNGALKYGWCVQDEENNELAKTSVANLENGDNLKTRVKGSDNAKSKIVQTDSKYGGVYIANNELQVHESWTVSNGTEVKNKKYINFTFWDQTEETTQGQDSLFALVRLPCYINVVDDIGPKAHIEPFYWNSWEDSSTVLDENGIPLGHIDLEADLTSPNNKKPKVSGKVYIEGTAKDETRLSAIYLTTPDANETHKIAEYTDGKWVPVTNGLPSHWDSSSIEVEELQRPSQKGHIARYRIAVDMTKYGVLPDKNVFVDASDGNSSVTAIIHGKTFADGGNASVTSDATPQTTADAPTGRYCMDFVPYIKSVEAGSSSNFIVRRSRLGRYPVQRGASITINGMNFTGECTVNFYKTDATTKQQGTTTSATAQTANASNGKITVNAPDYSCFVEVTVGGMKTQNNVNANERYNVQKGTYRLDKTTGKMNATDDVPGADFWTDDCYLSVWNVADASPFPGSINPHSGVVKKIDQYNSGSGAKNNMSDGNDLAAVEGPGGGYLYKQPGYSTEVTPRTNMNGNYYAAISSDDLKLYGYVSGDSYSGHGDNIAFNSSEVAYVSPCDELDYTIVNGMPYYVMQDNGLGGDSGSVWGLGLIMVREGIWYDRGYFNPFKGNTIEEAKLPYFIERQGYDKASHQRDSSTGYDSVLYQFKNPRIAGYYNATDSLRYKSGDGGKTVTGVDYIYVSYYDSYAKCLKYAGFRVGHRFKSNDHKYSNVALKEWGKNDVDHDIDIVAEWTTSPNTGGGNQPDQQTFDNMKSGLTVVAGNETTSNNPSYTEIAGEWSDIIVDPIDKKPVIVYYNKTNRCLEIAHGNANFPKSKSEWTYTKTVRPKGVSSDFGRYCSVAVDTSGNLHVAAQDADNAKLYYLYLTKSGSSYTVAKSVAVDGSSGAGRWTDIELTNPAGTSVETCKPVISYINTSFLGTTSGIKVAYLDSVDEKGNLHFEAMTDPAKYTAGDQRTSVMPTVYETKNQGKKAPVAVGFNSDMLALDFLRGEGDDN